MSWGSQSRPSGVLSLYIAVASAVFCASNSASVLPRLVNALHIGVPAAPGQMALTRTRQGAKGEGQVLRQRHQSGLGEPVGHRGARGPEVDRHRQVAVGLADALDPGGADIAGIVPEDVEPAEGGGRPGHHPAHRIHVRDVGADEDRLAAGVARDRRLPGPAAPRLVDQADGPAPAQEDGAEPFAAVRRGFPSLRELQVPVQEDQRQRSRFRRRLAEDLGVIAVQRLPVRPGGDASAGGETALRAPDQRGAFGVVGQFEISAVRFL
jgi:hypothetical protein